ncbi:MAG TPA: hypothetical protein VG347_25475 [Verrucomicrobiae bacterium]|nr:hypothetical protein [Verrucomicrobiae bacterium]
MTKFPAIFALLLAATLISVPVRAQEKQDVEIKALNLITPDAPQGSVEFDPNTGLMTYTNGVFVRTGNTVLTATAASVDSKTHIVTADGNVRIVTGDEIWVGDHINYNYETKQMQTEQFRTGKAPLYAGGHGLTGDISNKVYTASQSYVTTDDIYEPGYIIKASRIRLVSGQYVEMWNAVLWAGKVPVIYFPYYKRYFDKRANTFNVLPGYRSSYGGYLLGSYTWFLNEQVDGVVHVDYRSERGPAVGPDVNLHLGRWGDANISYYYLYDTKPNSSMNTFPFYGNIPKNRQRFYLGWQATPATNLNVKAMVNYQTDPLVLRDFFGGDYEQNPQPNTFIEAQKYSDNWSLDALATPRVNSFFNQIERLPDVKLTGYRQQISDTPLYYDSESSVGWYRSFAANATNGLYSINNGVYTNSDLRADTYHQITLPWTFFNWLNVAPRVGGRYTYYNRRSYADGGTDDVSRGVFNTGVEIGFKASSLWKDAKSSLLDVDGLRHIVEPSVNYVYVPNPSVSPSVLPQADGQVGAILISPIDFPDYNSIDSIDTMNVMRFGLRNILQTKRAGELQDLLNWNLMMDLRLDPQHGQSRLNDLYSEFAFRPRTWLTLEEQLRYDTEGGHLNLSFHQLTFTPNDRWSWGIGHLYLRGAAWGGGLWDENNFISSTMFFRISDNWGLRAQHDFNIVTGRLQQQYYSLYRDMRVWTWALTFRVEDDINTQPDYTVAIQFSLKASPAKRVGGDAVSPFGLVGE